LALREGNLDSAQAYFEEALATDRRLAAGSPEVPKNHLYLGGSLDRLAELARRRGNEALARAHAEESLEISMRLLDSQNPESMNDLAMGMVSVGQARLALGDTAGALALTETALEYARRAFAARSEPHVHDTIAELLELRGECLTPTRPAEARAAFDQAIEIWRGLVRETPTAEEYRPRLARALRAAAKIATEERRPALLDEAGAVDVQTHDPGQLM
jgi:tetratricopeptide (TPR) repeat protein